MTTSRYVLNSNTFFLRVKLKATDHDRYEFQLQPYIGPTILQESASPECGIDSLVGEPGDRATVPLGRERLKAHFALFSTREIQNNAHVGWKNHCDFAGILIYRTLIAVHCASIAAIARAS